MKRLTRMAMVGSLVLLVGCSMELVREHPLGCRLDERRLVRDTLYFGQAIHEAGTVTDDQWDAFVATRVLDVFPHGLIVFDAHGYWSGDGPPAASEASRVIVAIHPPDPAIDAKVRELVAEYKLRFHQQSVVRERSAVCAMF